MKIIGFPEQVQLNPEGFEDFGFVKDFTELKSRVSLDFDKLILVNEDYQRVYDWIYNRFGRFENIEAIVKTDTGAEYQHYLDLSNLRFTDDRVELGIQARKGTDHFFERAEGLSFELLRNQGVLTDDLFVDVPFLIVPNNLQFQKIVAIMLTISLIQQTRQLIFETQKIAADALDVIGTGALVTIAKVIAFGVYVALTVTQLVVAFKQLRDLYFPKLLFLKACSDYTLIKKGCEYLGFTLDSEFLYEKRFIHTLPKPQAQQDMSIFNKLFNEYSGDFNTGYPTALDSTPTLWQLIEDYIQLYNLKIFVYDGVVKIEPRSYFQNTASIPIAETFSLQDKRSREWTYNDNEVFGRKYLRWSVDYSDYHSPDISGAYQSETVSMPINVQNLDLVNLKGLNEYLSPFALGGRKDGLTGVEKIAKALFAPIDQLISLFGGQTLGSVIDLRDGCLLVESLYFQQTKKLWLNPDGKQPSDYLYKLSMDTVYNIYHKPFEVNNNCKRYVTMKIPFTMDNFHSLLTNNFVILDSGEVVEVLNIKYKDRKYYADITIALDDDSNFNVKTIKIA